MIPESPGDPGAGPHSGNREDIDGEPVRRRPERAGDVGEVIGDLFFRDPNEARELVGSARTLAKMAECWRSLASRGSDPARVVLDAGSKSVRTVPLRGQVRAA